MGYLDITDDVKFAWKAQRDIAERGATMEEVQAAIDGRKPDFAAYVEPQKAKADVRRQWFGAPVSVIEMDGKIDDIEEAVYIESHLCNAGTKYYGELSEQLTKNKEAPGSDNGTGLFQTVCSFKIREAYEALKKD